MAYDEIKSFERQLVDDGLIDSRIGKTDRRQRNLFLTESGAALEKQLSEVQRKNMRRAYSAAGPEAVQGFRTVLEAMIPPEVVSRMRTMLQGDQTWAPMLTKATS